MTESPLSPALSDGLRAFAADLQSDRTLTLTNRHGGRLVLTFHRMTPSDLETVLQFQTAVVSRIPDVENTNLFQSLTREEFSEALHSHLCIGAFHGGQLAGVLVLIPRPGAEQNLMLDLEEYRHVDPAQILVVDAVLVDGACRGFGLQRTFYRLADEICRKLGMRYECSVVSPLNVHSRDNTLRSGFRLVATLPKYRSTRHFFVREVSDSKT